MCTRTRTTRTIWLALLRKWSEIFVQDARARGYYASAARIHPPRRLAERARLVDTFTFVAAIDAFGFSGIARVMAILFDFSYQNTIVHQIGDSYITRNLVPAWFGCWHNQTQSRAAPAMLQSCWDVYGADD